MSDLMYAGVLKSKENLICDRVEIPLVGSEDVLVKIKVAGVCGSDISRILKGKTHFFPIILGHEFSGKVIRIGEKVRSIKAGERVVGIPLKPCFKCDFCKEGGYSFCENYSFIGSRENGAFAEFISLPEKNVIKIPEGVDYERGAFFEPSSVALHALKLSDFKKGSSVAVFGFGNIGYFLLQWAKILGANKIDVFDRDEEKLKIALEMGAKKTFLSFNKQLSNERYDFIFETSGDKDSLSFGIDIASKNAKICILSSFIKNINLNTKTLENINRKELRIYGSWMSYSSPFPGEEWMQTVRAFSKKEIKIHENFVAYRFPLEGIEKITEILKDKNRKKGKILIEND